MKRIFWLCLLLASPLSFGNFDMEGFLRVRGVSIQPHKLSAQKFLTNQTFRLEGSAYPNPSFQAHFWLLSSFNFGVKQPLGEIFRIYAFGRWLINENLRLLIGRTPYETSFHQFISSNEYEPYPYSFDGVFFSYGAKTVSLDLWGGYLPKRLVGDKEVQEGLNQGVGAVLDFKSVSEQLSRVSLHLIYLAGSFRKQNSKKMTRYGVGLEGDISFFNVDYTLLVQAQGKEFKAEDEAPFNMYHFELGYSWLNWHGSRFFWGYHNDTASYNPWLYDRHKNGGLLDLLLWGNMTYFFLGYSASFDGFFDLKVRYYDMKPTSAGQISLGRYGALLAGPSSGEKSHLLSPKEGHLGRELDIQLSKDVAEEFQLALLAGVFIPGRGMISLFENLSYYSSVQISAQYKF